ncbi:MAG: hypothetical protein WA783_01860, partial [Phormidesmis sp.]
LALGGSGLSGLRVIASCYQIMKFRLGKVGKRETSRRSKAQSIINDISSSYCTLGLWGPKAPQILQSVTQTDVSNPAFKFFTQQQFYIGYIPVLASRVSYVGEAGWEIYAPTESGLKLWDLLWAAGQAHGLIAAGLGAFETLRLEKGFLYLGARYPH